MKSWLRYAIGVLMILLVGLVFWWRSGENELANLITAEVKVGTISETVSVSGFIEADNTAELAFTAAGRISEVYVQEGDLVEAGTLLATVGQSRLAAERKAAQANLEKASAQQKELVNGQTAEERAVTEATVAQARAAWEQTTATELQKVQNALIALRSNDLTAHAVDTDESSVAPTVTGSYTCDEEGEYRIEVYSSNSQSGYSYRYSGLENGSESATVDQPQPLGSCGLSLQFSDTDLYSKSEWVISVPNTRSDTYVTYLNSYNLAVQQAEQNIQAAKETLALAENTATKETAAPRVEALVASNATVVAAQAELARIDALLADQSITAPFAGMVTDINKLPGEIATTEPMITLLAEDAFTLKARIPEIDITKLANDQLVRVVFDAKPSEELTGRITFINPIATEIDGVAYFETKIELEEKPDWLRAGLNADIDVMIDEKTDITYLPSRFIEKTEEGSFVTILLNGKLNRQPVQTGFVGNDGLVEVTNLQPGQTVVVK